MLERKIVGFYEAPLPEEYVSETVWSCYWDAIFVYLVSIAQLHNLLDGVTVNRNVGDPSVEGERDYLLWWNKLVLIVGEHNRDSRNLQISINEIKAKHKGLNKTVYSGLQYILAFATANSLIQFFMLPLPEKSNPIAISPIYDVRFANDKKIFIVGFFNMLRWVVGVTPRP